MAVYGGFGGLEIACCPGFHFNDTQHVPIPADEIEFAAMVGGAIVAGDDRIAAPAKVKISVFLAAPARAADLAHHFRNRRRGFVRLAFVQLPSPNGVHQQHAAERDGAAD